MTYVNTMVESPAKPKENNLAKQGYFQRCAELELVRQLCLV